MLKKWQGERPGHPIEVSKNLVDLATDLYQQAIVDEEEEEEQQDSGEENESIIDVDKALTSGEYKKYLQSIAELEQVDIIDMTNE